MKNKSRRIGIVGGMGPMAGVLLQQKIIEMTPAKTDQDHIEVVCYTNPGIPDRTKSLKENDGNAYVQGVKKSIHLLEKAGADFIIIPCNTSHARFEAIEKSASAPVLNMIDITLAKARSLKATTVGLLATDGTIASGVFNKKGSRVSIILPNTAEQSEIMDAIYSIKAGNYNDQKILRTIKKVSQQLQKRGAQKIIFGCTELSIYTDSFPKELVIDPLIELASSAVKLALK